jgi:membrane protein
MTEPRNETSAEEQAAARKKAKAKIRTIRIWAWVILALLAATALLSQCAMSKPQAKRNIIESCIKNIPFSDKWQADLKARGLEGQGDKVIADYCTCMWERPLDKLSDKQIRSFSKISAQEQLKLLGGANAFEERDRQCVANLKVR